MYFYYCYKYASDSHDTETNRWDLSILNKIVTTMYELNHLVVSDGVVDGDGRTKRGRSFKCHNNFL